MIVQTSAVQSG